MTMPIDTTKPRTLADVLQRLENDTTLAITRKRDRISAVVRVAEMLHRSPADLSAEAPALQPMLSGIHPARHGITSRTLSNIKSALADALRAVGALPTDDPKVEWTEQWKALLDHGGDAKHLAWSLSRLATYCSNREIEPADVDDRVFADFRGYLAARLLTKAPAKLCKEMAQSWNAIVCRNRLALATLTYERGGRQRCRPLFGYPESLQADFRAYQKRVSVEDIFDADAPRRAQKPTSLRNNEAHLRRYLDALTEAGYAPDVLTDFATIITPGHMKEAFRVMMARAGVSEATWTINNIAGMLLAIARHHLKLPADELEAIRQVRRRVFRNPKGMSPKNKDRLSQFNDWEAIVQLVSLPMVLMDEAEAGPASRLSGLAAMYAAALVILLACPMRAKNLAGLDLDRHVIAHRNGTQTAYTLRIEGAEVKNGEMVEVQLNHRNSQLLHRYITRYRSLIHKGGTSLFPQPSDGSPRTPSRFAADLQAVIQRKTGLIVNVHLFRHLAAKLYLMERPGDFETVRRLLKHRKLQTTMEFYAELSNQWAHDHYDEVVLCKWTGSHE